MFFRQLTPKEENAFKQWARENYQPHSEIKGVWHPIVQAECLKINLENSVFTEETLEC